MVAIFVAVEVLQYLTGMSRSSLPVQTGLLELDYPHDGLVETEQAVHASANGLA